MQGSSNLLPRPFYLGQLKPFMRKQLIKGLIGLRGVGKSSLLRLLVQEILSKDPDANIIFLDMEDPAFAGIRDWKDLFEFIHPRLKKTRRNYIFVDEPQRIKDAFLALRSLWLDPNNDIYIASSIQPLFGPETEGKMGGRCIEFPVFPLSYGEFLTFHSLADSDAALERYLRIGGLPGLANLSEEEEVPGLLKGHLDALLSHQFRQERGIRNTPSLGRLALLLAQKAGKILPRRTIMESLKAQGFKNSSRKLSQLLLALEERFLVLPCPQEESLFFSPTDAACKFFFSDLGLRNAVCGYSPESTAALAENAVFLHLASNGWQVTCLKMEAGRAFFCMKFGQPLFVGLVSSTASEQRRGVLLAPTPDPAPDNPNLMRISLRKFLLEKI